MQHLVSGQPEFLMVGIVLVEILRERMDLGDGKVVGVEAWIWQAIDQVSKTVLQYPVVVVDELNAEEHVLEDVLLRVASLEQSRLDLYQEVAIAGTGLKPGLVWVEPD
jgi:hypothetical protein